jgi:NADH dehydrogenase (ubiquinone) 1 alpha/beta subcomplex 1
MSFIRLALRSAVTRNLASPSLSRLHQSRLPQRAAFSAASALDKAHIETRVLDVLKSFEKVHPEKVCMESDVLK